MVNLEEGTKPENELVELLGNEEQELTAEAEEVEQDDTGEESDAADEADEEEAETDEAVDDEDADEEHGRYTVKVDGKEQKVSLQELKDGWMKDADYRRKTAEVADVRKKAEATEQRYGSVLGELEKQLVVVSQFLSIPPGIDDATLDKLAEENPAEFVRVKRDLEKRGGALNAVLHQLEDVRRQAAEKQQSDAAAFRESERAKLLDTAPQLGTQENMGRLHKYLNDTYGLTQNEIESVVDHRFALIADKARRFDAMQAKSSLKDKKVQKVAKVQRGGSVVRANEAETAQKKAYGDVMKSGSVNDLARMLG